MPRFMLRGHHLLHFLATLSYCISFAVAGPSPPNDASQPPLYQVPLVSIGALIGMLFMVLGRPYGAFKTYVGPAMGATSILWVLMSCGSAGGHSCAWVLFGSWLVLFLAYIAVEGHRAGNRKLYISMTLFASVVSVCITASIQNSDALGGFAVALPPCASFSAYTVGFFIFDRETP
ncbi:hypothetical protein EJ04DRAFT_591707 [Polyplosphaeria fusca]|uniref:Uncharacterized protein n=1 Tax=Polyplosphaeria fusca TaxID=682080 RepID=A0A9P4QKW5_9PLEO|nr:hypothetical protein EJ04DRAFT_591707 [Polyplosphaeria fusca]